MAKVATNSNFQELLQDSKLVVVDFWAEWCGPCKAVAPIVEQLATEYEGRVLIGKYDVDEGTDLAVDFGVRNIPTILFFKDGKMVDRQVGSSSYDDLKAKVEALL